MYDLFNCRKINSKALNISFNERNAENIQVSSNLLVIQFYLKTLQRTIFCMNLLTKNQLIFLLHVFFVEMLHAVI